VAEARECERVGKHDEAMRREAAKLGAHGRVCSPHEPRVLPGCHTQLSVRPQHQCKALGSILRHQRLHLQSSAAQRIGMVRQYWREARTEADCTSHCVQQHCARCGHRLRVARGGCTHS
jgi:hypothetical protein